MTKYKIIKEYPGSPELGTVVEGDKMCNFKYSRDNRQFCVLNSHAENNPEYWEKVNENLWWCVWERDYDQDLVKLFRAWFAYKIDCVPTTLSSERHYFKTKEEADNFITRNKPCLSLNDVSLILGVLDRKRDIFLELKRIVKSRL
jgi:hypothetical protein